MDFVVPKLNVLTMRWMLVFANTAVIALTGWMSYQFFFAERPETDIELPEVANFKVELEDRSRAKSAALNKLVVDLNRKPPVTRAPVQPKPQVEQEARPGGPLKDWIVESVLSDPEGSVYAIIRERTETSTRVTSPTPRRTRSSRRSSSRRSRSRTTAPKYETELVYEGKEFRAGGQDFVCDKITDSPKAVQYRQGRQLFTITGEEVVHQSLSEENGVFTLRGLDDDELEEDPARKGAPEEIDPGDRGSIQAPRAGATKKEAGSRARTADEKKEEDLKRAAKLLEESGQGDAAKKILEKAGEGERKQ